MEDFVSTFDPPLLPALQGSAYETQISLADDPPAYDEANKVLKVSINAHHPQRVLDNFEAFLWGNEFLANWRQI